MITRGMSKAQADAHVAISFKTFNPFNQRRISKVFQLGRKRTGVRDSLGSPICTGHVVQMYWNANYPKATRLVYWDDAKAAFCMFLEFSDGGGASSPNMEDSDKCEIIGSIFDSPELFSKTKSIQEEGG